MKKIIIVEDDLLLQAEYESFLTKTFGEAISRVVSLPNAERLLTTHQSIQADLIITDLVMDSHKEGIAGIIDIRSVDVNVPIIVISGYAVHLSTAEMFDVDTLVKPVNLEHLSALITKRLGIKPLG